jgi:predicted nucleotide-binding protein
MAVAVFVHPESEHVGRVREAAKLASDAQDLVEFTTVEAAWLPQRNSKSQSGRALISLIEARRSSFAGAVAVIDAAFEDEYFSHEGRTAIVVTTAGWDNHFAPPPLASFLSYQLAGAVLTLAVDIPGGVATRMQHEPPIGCFFDFCGDKHSIKIGMAAAYVCATCHSTLRMYGMREATLAATEAILNRVRASVLARPAPTPRDKIFIGHGRAGDWRELQAFLEKELSLPVTEFQLGVPTGRNHVDVLTTMLEEARFAFIVLSGEDTTDSGELRARQNVVHEAGLFQGRLGFNRAILVVEEGVELFSNADGLNYVAYRAGHIIEQSERIRAVLRSNRVLRT